ncbi:MAG: glycosidase protein [Pseudonocardiales bacterium]|nr:glycosidase protein [Pseudonocardiales bacterium]
MTPPLAHRTGATLNRDPARVVARLFLPGEELHLPHSRAQEIVARVMSLDEPEVERIVAQLLEKFAARHPNYEELLIGHASVVAAHTEESRHTTHARTLLLGATFTAEYAVEAAAVCNPSAMLHPDQSSLADGEVRIAISLRGIGEGHVSSIGFCSAVVGPGERWSFSPRPSPIAAGTVSPTPWHKAHLRAALADQGHVDELAQAVLHALPVEFSGASLEQALAGLHPDLLSRPGAATTVELVRRLVSSSYAVEFTDDTALEQRVLLPSAAEESHGMEDARFTRHVDDDGTVDYRATYTAYDGQRIAPRLLTSPDLRVFQAHRLAGPAARNKGMALFPRQVEGRHLALCRSNGESTSLASSADGYIWNEPKLLQEPTASWESLQVGNCGPPIETDDGWLVITHGVGAMRTYAIGAILLDLRDPSIVLGRLECPLLEPDRSEQDGYVPNVLYSCGAFAHDGILWLPYGIGDARIGLAWSPIAEVLGALTRT